MVPAGEFSNRFDNANGEADSVSPAHSEFVVRDFMGSPPRIGSREELVERRETKTALVLDDLES